MSEKPPAQPAEPDSDAPSITEATSASLLDKAKTGESDAWSRLYARYSPLVFKRCRRAGLSTADADCVTQDIFLDLFRRLERFERQRPGSFRRFLRLLTRSRLVDFLRKTASFPKTIGEADRQLKDDETLQSQHSSDAEARFQQLRQIVKTEFTDRDWAILFRYVAEEQSAAHIAEDLGVSVNVVYLTKARILKRIREYV
ncbi:RNA polymerase sigma factor [Stratiformator vulcanicus]|uniref:RNA polymerase sigma factor n=1 Tax=Stratiformator vulcanicus TaxID=2527980 RepID=A0A517QYB7_9PLAN|nr:sigma-70 family RNA polymerase sigma factor [Stratiformator vulcanicus]QDT36632.1 RNA polymerase sigma factor [Stratiformator vulcanicus]